MVLSACLLKSDLYTTLRWRTLKRVYKLFFDPKLILLPYFSRVVKINVHFIIIKVLFILNVFQLNNFFLMVLNMFIIALNTCFIIKYYYIIIIKSLLLSNQQIHFQNSLCQSRASTTNKNKSTIESTGNRKN